MATTYDATKDKYAFNGTGPDTFGNRATAITPSDTVDLTSYPKAVMVTAAGDLSLLPVKGTDGTFVTISGAPVGLVIPFRVRRVNATGTTASVATIDD